MTDVGESVLAYSGGKKCIDENLNYFIEQIDKTASPTLYDIKKTSIGAIMDSFNKDMVNDVKEFIYKTPDMITVDVGGRPEQAKVTQNDIQMLMGVYLRDRYMENR